MTVQNTNTKNIYVGNDVTRVFPYTFQIAEKHISYIKVYVEKGGVIEEVTEFSIDASAKTVTYPLTGAPLTSGTKIVIAREVPLIQMLNLVNQGPYFAEDIETAIDETVMICQQINELVGRTLGISISVDSENIDMSIPYAPGKAFAWNKEGTGFEVTENPADVLPKVQAELNVLKEYVVAAQKEIAATVESLNSLTREELQNLRDECEDFSYKAEQSALANTRWPVGSLRPRPSWKNDFDIEGQDLFLTVPQVVKIDVTEE